MWKRDQSKGILKRRGRKKIQTIQKERRRSETRNKRMRNNGRPKETEKILNDTGKGIMELKAIMEKRRAIQDEEERQ